ncbi:MAG: hypothetical protein ACJ77Z_01880 [Thermoleophilaceae bacterium]
MSKQAHHQKKVSRRRQRTLDAAGRIVAGGLVETMIEWVSGSADRAADEVIEDFTTLAARLFEVRSRPGRVAWSDLGESSTPGGAG